MRQGGGRGLHRCHQRLPVTQVLPPPPPQSALVPPMQTIDVPTTVKNLQDGAVLIDVLPEIDYQRQHIPGAINIPVDRDDFETRVAKAVPDRSTPVIVYCTDEDCEASPRAAKRMEQMGYSRVMDLEVGIEGWKRVHDVERGTAQVRADL